jgi:hypothetical protein
MGITDSRPGFIFDFEGISSLSHRIKELKNKYFGAKVREIDSQKSCSQWGSRMSAT